jgi:hypothetical protein
VGLADDHERLSNSTGWPSLTSTCFTTPPAGAVIGFITFIASMISKVSPGFTESPTATNGLAPGSGDRKAVPTIGDLTALAGASSAARAAGAAAAGRAAAMAGTACGTAANIGAASRQTRILRSPSSTSISVSSLADSSSASSRTNLVSTRMAPSLDLLGFGSAMVGFLFISAAHPCQSAAAASSARI